MIGRLHERGVWLVDYMTVDKFDWLTTRKWEWSTNHVRIEDCDWPITWEQRDVIGQLPDGRGKLREQLVDSSVTVDVGVTSVTPRPCVHRQAVLPLVLHQVSLEWNVKISTDTHQQTISICKELKLYMITSSCVYWYRECIKRIGAGSC